MPFVYFPPRLIHTDETLDPNRQIDAVVTQYKDQGLVVLCDEDGLRDVQKIIAFAGAFESLQHPDDVKPK